MANKCGNCGKFLAVADTVKCIRCCFLFHRACAVNKSPDSKAPKWICKGCKPKPCSPAPVSALSSMHIISSGNQDVDSPMLLTGQEEAEVASSLLEQIKLLRIELVAVTHEVSSFRQELLSLKNTMSEVGKRVDNVEMRLAQLEETTTSPNSGLLREMAQLKSELNDRDQACLTNDVEITGITERAGESLPHILDLVSNKIGVQLDERDVVYVERSGPRPAYAENSERPRPRPIVVRLARRAIRDQLLRAARVRRGADSSGFEIDKEPRRFYINERLTKPNRLLFHKAREDGRKNGWRYIWTREGRIYARRNKETSAHRIRSQDDLMTVFGQTSV
ncbi:unnamed protein product [Danaus chrysippus]|uniref:(African queen) hypothetical protein n=1 Tax=Danaus chrysippus TaxID=151541 RepID=A0A8J2R387_9NEOP|nr:unnamed protein product [Danaus chrysippus]